MSLALLQAFLYRKAVAKDFRSLFAERMDLSLKFQSDEKICRICSKEGNIPIFDHIPGKSIADDINKCSDITVFPNDGFPRYLCMNCYNLLKNAVKFRKMCLQSNETLRKLKVKQTAVLGPSEPKTEVPVEYVIKDCDSAARLSPVGGPEAFFTKDEFPNCITCKEDFMDIDEYKKHLPDCNKELMKRRKVQPKKRAITKPLKITRKTKAGFLCEVCGQTLTHYCSYLTHKQSLHGNTFAYKCEHCPYRGKTRDLLRIHLRSHLSVKPYVCEVCPGTFTTSSNLAKHRRMHLPQEPQKCLHCDKIFGRKEQLARHIADIHVGSKPVDCDVCGKRFRRRKELVKHRLKQHKLRTARGGRLPAYLLAGGSPPPPSPPPPAHIER